MPSCVRKRSRPGRPKKSSKQLCKSSKKTKRSGKRKSSRKTKRSGKRKSSKKRSSKRSKKRSSKSKCPKTKMASCSRHSLRTLKRVANSLGITGSTKSSLCKKLIRKSGGWGVRGCKKITRLE